MDSIHQSIPSRIHEYFSYLAHYLWVMDKKGRYRLTYGNINPYAACG